MPNYEYECPDCGPFEVHQRMSDPPLSRHAACGSPVERRISAVSFALKGGGWYADGYAGKGAAACAPGGCAKPDCAAKS